MESERQVCRVGRREEQQMADAGGRARMGPILGAVRRASKKVMLKLVRMEGEAGSLQGLPAENHGKFHLKGRTILLSPCSDRTGFSWMTCFLKGL